MSKTLPERLRDAARKLRTSNMPLSDFIPLLQQAADALESRAMSKTLPPLPALPPAEVQEWSESWITLRGEGWTRETVEKYASDYALAAIEKGRDRQSVPAFDSVRLTRFLTDVVTAAGLLSHGKQSKAVAERVAKEACAIRSMLAAAPQPQPLSDQEIADAAPVNETLAHGFKLGVRWADAAHGIKE